MLLLDDEPLKSNRELEPQETSDTPNVMTTSVAINFFILNFIYVFKPYSFFCHSEFVIPAKAGILNLLKKMGGPPPPLFFFFFYKKKFYTEERRDINKIKKKGAPPPPLLFGFNYRVKSELKLNAKL